MNGLRLEQEHSTIIYEGNAATIKMAHAQKPTRCTNRMHIKQFFLLQWCESNQIILSYIVTSNNLADGRTHTLHTVLFHRHKVTLIGNMVPRYVSYTIPYT